MNLSAGRARLGPRLVVTTTSTLPFDSAGEVAVIELSDVTTNDAGRTPNSTFEAPVKPVPVMVTAVAPVDGPESGLTPVTAGRGGRKVNWSAVLVALVPPLVVTVTSTFPLCAAGETAVIDTAVSTVNDVADADPNLTPVAPLRFVPVMVTVVPPLAGPELGLTPETAGGGGLVAKVKMSCVEVGLVPPGVRTVR